MCKHKTTKSNIDLYATDVSPLNLVSVRVRYIEYCVTSCYVWQGFLGGWTVRTAVPVVQVAKCTTRSLQPTLYAGHRLIGA